MKATYAINGDKIHRNGKLIARLTNDDLAWQPGQQQFKTEVLDFLADLEEDEEPEPGAPDPLPQASASPPAKKKATAKKVPPTKEAPGEVPEPPQSGQFGDLTEAVVLWRKEHWEADRFRETYHRRLTGLGIDE